MAQKIAKAVADYKEALQQLTTEAGDKGIAAETVMTCLLSRDAVQKALSGESQPMPAALVQLPALDAGLRARAGEVVKVVDLPAWRQTFHPADTAWWWFLDQKVEEREKEKDLLWMLLTGTLLMLTVLLATEIIKRLLVGAPDTVSIIGTLLTLLLTGSPLFKRGQELAQWVFKRIFRLEPRSHAKAMAGMGFLTFVAVLMGWLSLPQLAVLYNNQGHAALCAGNLTAAQRDFQRAVALNPDLVVPYYHLANIYQRIGRSDEALTWYQRTIECDPNFGPAYSGLGHLYNLRGEFAQAEWVLLAGLACEYDEQDVGVKTVTRYALLSDLGWAYFAQERYERAREALEEAVALESRLKELGESTLTEYRPALPHYYLAQVYEHLERPEDAYHQWEESLRFLDQDDWSDRDRIATASSHLEQLEEGQ